MAEKPLFKVPSEAHNSDLDQYLESALEVLVFVFVLVPVSVSVSVFVFASVFGELCGGTSIRICTSITTSNLESSLEVLTNIRFMTYIQQL